MTKNRLLIPISLTLFNAEKTETATSKKRKDQRKEGNVAQSKEISTAAVLIIMFSSMALMGPMILAGISDVFFTVFTAMYWFNDGIINLHYIADLVVYMFTRVIMIALPLLLLSLGVGIFVNLLQVKWAPTTKPLMPKLSKLNPIKGFKKIVSIKSLIELFKSLLKLVIIGIVIFVTLASEIDSVAMLMSLTLIEAFAYTGMVTVRLGITVGAWFIFIAALDFSFVKWKHEKDMKMSKQEVKDEYKQSEGNPEIKGKIRQKMREASMRRMMQDIPQADVIITNPTHYSVAISYDRNGATAPKVIAKGVDHLALRIREVGKENNITIVENVQLARALYAAVDIGREIPEELFKSVAEVLAYVYRLKNMV